VRGKGLSHGAGTIVNAIATGKGAAFGLDLRTEATVELDSSGEVKVEMEGVRGEDPELAERCVRNVLIKCAPREGYGAKVVTRSQIPISRGLKSSSAAANAIVLATLDALGMRVDPLRAIKIGTKSALEARVSITGAFDDACASLLGGVVLTDNSKERVVKRGHLPAGLRAVIHVPQQQIRKHALPLERMRALAPAVETAFHKARQGRYTEAMLINSLSYSAALGLSMEVTFKALAQGAHAAGLSGTGPATVMLVDDRHFDTLVDAFDRREIIITDVFDEGSKEE
jgi:shikimate kinase